MPPSTAQSLHNDIVSRLGKRQNGNESDVGFTSPEAGSRSNRDAVEVKGESSRPVSSKSVNRTDVPFFCHDLTPRSVRMPFDGKKKTAHPCGAIGISAVQVIVRKARLETVAELYGYILGAKPGLVDVGGECERSDFEIGLPIQGLGPALVSLRSERDEIDQDWLRDRGTGICGLLLTR